MIHRQKNEISTASCVQTGPKMYRPHREHSIHSDNQIITYVVQATTFSLLGATTEKIRNLKSLVENMSNVTQPGG